MRPFPSLLFSSLLFLAAATTGLAAAPDRRTGELAGAAAATDQFERAVRPLLAGKCGSCHGTARQEGGLRLDSRAAALRGGSRGPALTPGDPARSLLIQALRRRPGAPAMPPGRPLEAPEIQAVEQWIAGGAVWPAAPTGPDRARRHWAFQPLSRPRVPAVRRREWVRNPVDAFVLAELERAGLSPSPEADRRTLIRRLTFDLIGLPPAPEEVDAFLADPDPRAYEKVVERLLASPEYGVRWGRHWLDVARYADTKDGVLMYGDARLRPYAYTYRDYVVRALNEDTPYDQFIREQLAADQIRPAVEPWRLGAMGFLTLGRMFDNNIHDVLDDRIDVTTRGFLGLTASCARCHDHKYDPIPTADYYSLYGVFASSEAPLELPVIGAAADERAGQEFLGKVKTQIQEIRQFLETQYSQESRRAGERVPDYLVRAATEKPDPLETAIFFLSLAPEDLRPQIVHRWRLLLAQRARPEDPVFGPWTDWMALPDGEMRERTPALLARWAARPVGTQPGQLNPLVLEALGAARPSNRAAVARAYGSLLARVYADGQVPNPVLRPEARQLLELVTGPQSPSYFRKDQTWHYMSRGEKDSYAGKLVALDKMAVNAAHPPPRAMVLQDSPELYEPRVFLRGSPSQPGPAVPRQFLAVASSGQREPFRRGSGRLELAEAIGHPDNPLTARVLVNRIWMHHFGEPLVANPGDFGTRSAPPTHPALLDWLASWFVGRIPAAGEQPFTWKRLHRLLVLSSTYRQQSADRPAARSRDPENRLLWRANRRRLELEAMRDGMLAVADRLDRTQGGRPADLAGDPENRRRTLYGVVDRQSLPGLYRAFDFASPDQSAERRPRTTTPQQALFALNNPFVLRQARALAALPEVAAGSPDERITALYRRIFARAPEPAEREGALRFLAAAAGLGRAGERKLDPVSQLAQVLLLTNEFLFVD